MELWDFFTQNGIRFISMQKWLDEGVDLAFSTRLGGVSSSVFESLNLGLHVEDQNQAVLENRRRLLSVFHAQLEDAVCCQQVHGHNIARIERRDRSRGAFRLDEAIPDCDAMITDCRGVYLLSFYADCIPVYFYDPSNQAVGTAHCGWKGTMGRIAARTLKTMQREYGTSAAEVKVFIGPGIGPCCFQIQPDLKTKVNAEFPHLHDIITYNDDENIYWDLPETNRQLLLEAGVKASNICTCRLCTACHPEIFYSYRREKGRTGRMGALIGLKI